LFGPRNYKPMSCFTGNEPSVPTYGGLTRSTLATQSAVMPNLFGQEAQWQPKFNQLALANLNTVLPGTLAAQSQSRAADVGDIEALTGRVTSALQNANPQQAALMKAMNDQALQGINAGTSLTPDQQQQAQQSARAAYASRGMGAGNQAVASELFNNYALGNQMQQQRRAFGTQVAGINSQYTSPALAAIMGSNSGLNTATGLTQHSGPSLFNPESSEAAQIAAAKLNTDTAYSDPSLFSKLGTVASVTQGFKKTLPNEGNMPNGW